MIVCAFLLILHLQEPAREEPTRIPFDILKTGHMVVSVKVNGQGPFRLIFDTGAPVTLVSSKLGKQSGITPSSKISLPLFGNGGQVTIKKMEVGNCPAEDIQAILMDHPTVELISKFFGPIEGILGYTFFSKYQISIDYKEKVMEFSKSNHQAEDVLKKMVDNLMKREQKPRLMVAKAFWGFDAAANDTHKGTVTIKSVLAKSPAETAGLLPGDHLTDIDGIWIYKLTDLFWVLQNTFPDRESTMLILREGKPRVLKITPKTGI